MVILGSAGFRLDRTVVTTTIDRTISLVRLGSCIRLLMTAYSSHYQFVVIILHCIWSSHLNAHLVCAGSALFSSNKLHPARRGFNREVELWPNVSPAIIQEPVNCECVSSRHRAQNEFICP